jgi:class 3 adenylate cyclase
MVNEVAVPDRLEQSIREAKCEDVLRRFLAQGNEVKTTGNGILATFDGPARGVRCACTIAEEIRPLGIDVRAGLHTGECEIMGSDVGVIAVHIGARVASLAGAGEVLVSRTVKVLVAGSGLRFAEAAKHSSEFPATGRFTPWIDSAEQSGSATGVSTHAQEG